jgi:hypothetical protein
MTSIYAPDAALGMNNSSVDASAETGMHVSSRDGHLWNPFGELLAERLLTFLCGSWADILTL